MAKENESYEKMNQTVYSAFGEYLNKEHLGGVAQLAKYRDLAKKVKNYIESKSDMIPKEAFKPLPEVTKELINKHFGNKE